MLVNILIFIAVILLAIGLAQLTRRAWRIRSFFKWIATPLAGLLTLLVAAIAVLGGIGLSKFYIPRGNPPPDLKVELTQERIDRGQHLASASCADCHSPNKQLPLTGGPDFGKDAGIPIGSLVPYNLTPGGPLKDWSDGEIFRAIREGVDRNNKPLLTMQGIPYRNMSDEDIQAVIAYLRSQEPVENMAGGDQPSFVFALFAGAGLVPDPGPSRASITAPPKAANVEYGQYMVSWAGCHDCHGPDLKGGKGGLTPAGPNLVSITSSWQPDQFVQTLRTGVDPTGHEISTVMPWKTYKNLDDVELKAILAYLQSLK